MKQAGVIILPVFVLHLISYSLPTHRYIAKNGLGAGSFATETPSYSFISILCITTTTKKKSLNKKLKQHILQCDTCEGGTVVEFSTPHSTSLQKIHQTGMHNELKLSKSTVPFTHSVMHTWLVASCKLFMVASVREAAHFFFF